MCLCSHSIWICLRWAAGSDGQKPHHCHITESDCWPPIAIISSDSRVNLRINPKPYQTLLAASMTMCGAYTNMCIQHLHAAYSGFDPAASRREGLTGFANPFWHLYQINFFPDPRLTSPGRSSLCHVRMCVQLSCMTDLWCPMWQALGTYRSMGMCTPSQQGLTALCWHCAGSTGMTHSLKQPTLSCSALTTQVCHLLCVQTWCDACAPR